MNTHTRPARLSDTFIDAVILSVLIVPIVVAFSLLTWTLGTQKTPVTAHPATTTCHRTHTTDPVAHTRTFTCVNNNPNITYTLNTYTSPFNGEEINIHP